MKRRQFLQSSSMLATAGLFGFNPVLAHTNSLKKIGVQLFSLPKLLEKDFSGGITMLAQMGYKEVELYGPFPFSALEAIQFWNAVTPSLGFSGSGYFGHTAKEVKDIFTENKITIPSIHTDLITLRKNMNGLGEAGQTLGFQYVGLPAIPEANRKNLDDYKKIADEFNTIGEQAKKAGLKFSYHNHGYGLKEIDGQIPLNMILERTDPKLVFFEMDIFWTVAGGADPVEYLKSYPNRYRLMHVKDMKQKKQFSGDGGDSKQWIELFSNMTTAGDGVLDLKSIISQAQKSGVKHFFVEQDMVAEPEVALKKSLDSLKAL
ncbi:MAG: sugar phosphate isomerase/epimerase [Bacteroidota bacterium]